ALGWAGLGDCYANLDEPDSALAAFRRCQLHPERVTELGRLFNRARIADLSGGIEGALSSNEELVPLAPQTATALNNRSYYLSCAGRLSEAVEAAKAAERVSPFGPSQQVLNNQFWNVLLLGRMDEARSIVPRLKGYSALIAAMQYPAVAGQW